MFSVCVSTFAEIYWHHQHLGRDPAGVRRPHQELDSLPRTSSPRLPRGVGEPPAQALGL